jgi:hypothetical protein
MVHFTASHFDLSPGNQTWQHMATKNRPFTSMIFPSFIVCMGISQPCLMTPEDHFPFFTMNHEGTNFSCRSDTSLNWSSGSNMRQRLGRLGDDGGQNRLSEQCPKKFPKNHGGNHQESYFDEHANGS